MKTVTILKCSHNFLVLLPSKGEDICLLSPNLRGLLIALTNKVW